MGCRSLSGTRRSLQLCLSLPLSFLAECRPKMSKFRFAIEISAQPQIAHNECGQRRPAPSHSVTLIGTRRQRLTRGLAQFGRDSAKLQLCNPNRLLYFYRQTQLRMPKLTQTAHVKRQPQYSITIKSLRSQAAIWTFLDRQSFHFIRQTSGHSAANFASFHLDTQSPFARLVTCFVIGCCMQLDIVLPFCFPF